MPEHAMWHRKHFHFLGHCDENGEIDKCAFKNHYRAVLWTREAKKMLKKFDKLPKV
jgi:hypothetical protein